MNIRIKEAMIGIILNIKMAKPLSIAMDIELLEANPPWAIKAYPFFQEIIVAKANGFFNNILSQMA